MRIMAVVFVVLMAACGGDDGPVTADDVADDVGCSRLVETDTGELYVRERFECERSEGTTIVYTFNSSTARDSWRDVAEEFGIVVLSEDDRWVEVEEMVAGPGS